MIPEAVIEGKDTGLHLLEQVWLPGGKNVDNICVSGGLRWVSEVGALLLSC